MNPDGECPKAPQRHHNWMVYRHNVDWTRVECWCSRCAATCKMSSEDYIAVLKAAKRSWDAFVERSRSS
jgi:hypothetical protein